MDLADSHSIFLFFFFLCMVVGFYRMEDPYCISATDKTCAVADCYLLKFWRHIFWMSLTYLSGTIWFNQLEDLVLIFLFMSNSECLCLKPLNSSSGYKHHKFLYNPCMLLDSEATQIGGSILWLTIYSFFQLMFFWTGKQQTNKKAPNLQQV